jgi:hypothetical protein
MMTLMRPVVDFLNAVKRERDALPDDQSTGHFESLILSSSKADVTRVTTRALFTMPTIPVAKERRTGPVVQRIQYDKPLIQVQNAMRALKVHSYKQVGERTFDYYYKSEIEE